MGNRFAVLLPKDAQGSRGPGLDPDQRRLGGEEAPHAPVEVGQGPPHPSLTKGGRTSSSSASRTPGRQVDATGPLPGPERPADSGPGPGNPLLRPERPPPPSIAETGLPPGGRPRRNRRCAPPPPGRCWSIPPVAPLMAHAVDHHPARLGGGNHHLSAGAHAEGIDAPARGRVVVGQGVIGRRQVRMTGMTVLNGVDQLRRMFDPQPHGEGLALQAHPGLRPASGRYPGHCVRGPAPGLSQGTSSPSSRIPARTRPGRESRPVSRVSKRISTPRSQQGLPEIDQHPPQAVGPHVGLGLRQDLFRGAEDRPGSAAPGGSMGGLAGWSACRRRKFPRPLRRTGHCSPGRAPPPAQKRRTSPTRSSTGRPRSTRVTARP